MSREIRSVNHRYLEISFRIDEAFRLLEMLMRKLITDKLSRGKIEIDLRYKSPEHDQVRIRLNDELADSLIAQYEQLAERTKNRLILI